MSKTLRTSLSVVLAALGLAAVLGLAALPARSQPPALASDGFVSVPGEQIRVSLTRAVEAPVGAYVYTYRPVEASGRTLGLVTGVYLIVAREADGSLRAVRDAERSGGLPGAERGAPAEIVAETGAAVLVLTTEPAGARILWNGLHVGTTPDTLSLAGGEQALRLEHPSRLHQTYPFTITPGLIQEQHVVLDAPRPCDELVSNAEGYFQRLNLDEVDRQLGGVLRRICTSPPADTGALAAWQGALPAVREALRGASPGVQPLGLAFAVRRFHEARARADTAAEITQLGLLCQLDPRNPYVQTLTTCPGR